MNPTHPTLSVRFDDDTLCADEPCMRYMLLEVEAPALPVERHNMLPLNMGLVVDASGSMRGSRLESSKAALHQLIDALNEVDTVSLVSFASDAVVHATPQRLDETGRRTLHEEVGKLRTRGSTDLFAGWWRGALCTAEIMELGSPARNRILLLSDGRANRGEMSLTAIQEHAEQVSQRGLLTSTVGIGAGYSPRYIQTLASAGGGAMHDTDTGEDLIDVLLGELDDARQAVAQNAEIHVALPDGVEAVAFGIGDEHTTGGTLRIRLGSLFENRSRRVVVRLHLPAVEFGERLELSARLVWSEPGFALQQHESDTVVVSLETILESELPRVVPDRVVADIVAEVWNAWAIRMATTLNEQREFQVAARFLDEELARFEVYVCDLPRGRELLQELRWLRHRVERRLNPVVSKHLATGAYKDLHGTADKRRRVKPGGWKGLLADEGR